MKKDAKVYVAGHRGLVGSAIVRRLEREGFTNLLTRTHKDLDLTEQAQVREFFVAEKPEYVFLAAAKVGGIEANRKAPADFYYQNSMIEANIIHSAYENGVTKLLFLGSSCIYPRECPQPIKEEYLLSGYLEQTNEAYAIAKIAGLKMCEYYRKQYGADFISAMPCNLYGPGDNFDPVTSHVIPALIRKFAEAKEQGASYVTVWGSGTPLREFLYVDDLADASVFLMQNYSGEQHVNVGTGKEITIADLARLIGETAGYEGEIRFDASMPDGTPRKVLDVSHLTAMGWTAKTPLQGGLKAAVDWFSAL
jgi:GDP-L-fucose synthase